MKQKFTVTGITCAPHDMCHAMGTPPAFHLRGRSESALAPRFCPTGQNPCTHLTVRALSRHAEQVMPEGSLL